MRVTTPGTSLLTATLFSPDTLPGAAMVVSQGCAWATAEPMTSGGGPDFCIFFPMETSEPIWAPLIPARSSTSPSRPTPTRMYRNGRACLSVAIA